MDHEYSDAEREHIINTQWQELVDRVYNSDADDYITETNLALELLQACHFRISFEILRVGSIKLSDALIRIEEESEDQNG